MPWDSHCRKTELLVDCCCASKLEPTTPDTRTVNSPAHAYTNWRFTQQPPRSHTHQSASFFGRSTRRRLLEHRLVSRPAAQNARAAASRYRRGVLQHREQSGSARHSHPACSTARQYCARSRTVSQPRSLGYGCKRDCSLFIDPVPLRASGGTRGPMELRMWCCVTTSRPTCSAKRLM